MNKDLKKMLKGVFVILLYLFYAYCFSWGLSQIGIKFNNLNLITKEIISLSTEFILITIIIYIYRKDIVKSLKNFYNIHFSNYIKYLILAIGLMIISNVIIYMITSIETSSNQQAIVDTLEEAPIYTCILAVIFAPVLEELVFRLSFRKMFKTNTLFIIISGLFFGFMHISSSNNLLEFIYIIPYSIPGCVFAYTLTKSDNICVPILLHFMHNSLIMLLQFSII